MKMLRVIVLMAMISALAAPVVASDDSAPAPLQEAMHYLLPHRDIASVSFIDWAQLKRLHDGEDITSASQLQDRQRLMLDIVRAQALPPNLGLDLLASWPEAWGWDSTDLDWEARFLDGRRVLRFGEHWQPQRLRDALERYGYKATVTPVGQVWQPADDAEMPRDLLLIRLDGLEPGGLPDRSQPWTPLTIASNERTVVIHFHSAGEPLKRLKRASRPDPERGAGTSVMRAATALGHPVAAFVVSGSYLCSRSLESELANAPADVVAEVSSLHDYEARAEGYGRADASAPLKGRFVFSYPRPWQAREDATRRSLLIEQPHPWNPSQDAAADFVLAGAEVEGADLTLEVEPVTGRPRPSFGSPSSSYQYFAMCGPTDESD